MQAAAKEADGVKAGVAAVATTRKSRQLEIFTGRSLVCVSGREREAKVSDVGGMGRIEV